MKNIISIKKLNWTRIGLAVILLVAVVFRFYNTPNRYGFDFDASRDALITLYGAQHFIFPPLGPASAIGFFHFGPWYYYFLVLFKILIPFAYAPWILNSLLAVLSVYVAFLIGEELFDKKFGLIFAIMVALSPAQIIASTGLSNPDFVILPSFLSIWLFIKLVKDNLPWWWSSLFGFVLGIGINMHFQMLTYLILPVIGFFFIKQKKIIYTMSVFIGLLVAFFPWIIFDSTHQWVNTLGFLRYLRTGDTSIYVPNSWTIYLKTFWPQFWSYVLGVPIIGGAIIALISIISIMILAAEKKLPRGFILLLVAFFVLFIYFRYYSGVREVYYTLFLHPFIFLIAAIPFWWLLNVKRGFLVAGIAIIILISLMGLRSSQEFHTMASHQEDQSLLKSLTHRGLTSFQFYQCSTNDSAQAQGLVFLASIAHQADLKGAKVGLLSTSCSGSLVKEAKATIHTLDPSIKLVVLSKRNMKGWKLVTPESVYTQAMNKWIQ